MKRRDTDGRKRPTALVRDGGCTAELGEPTAERSRSEESYSAPPRLSIRSISSPQRVLALLAKRSIEGP